MTSAVFVFVCKSYTDTVHELCYILVPHLHQWKMVITDKFSKMCVC